MNLLVLWIKHISSVFGLICILCLFSRSYIYSVNRTGVHPTSTWCKFVDIKISMVCYNKTSQIGVCYSFRYSWQAHPCLFIFNNMNRLVIWFFACLFTFIWHQLNNDYFSTGDVRQHSLIQSFLTVFFCACFWRRKKALTCRHFAITF